MASKKTAVAAPQTRNYWAESSREFVDSARKLTDIANRVVEKTNEQNQSVIQYHVDAAVRNSQEFANIRDINAFVEKQVAFIQQAGEQFKRIAEGYTVVAQEAQAEYAAWVDNATKAANAKVEQAFAKAA